VVRGRLAGWVREFQCGSVSAASLTEIKALAERRSPGDNRKKRTSAGWKNVTPSPSVGSNCLLAIVTERIKSWPLEFKALGLRKLGREKFVPQKLHDALLWTGAFLWKEWELHSLGMCVEFWLQWTSEAEHQ